MIQTNDATDKKKGDIDCPTFVLVHGTCQWSGQWDPLSSILRKEGYPVHSPTLTGLGEREHLLSKQIGLSTHITDIENYITWFDLKDIILVGHSYGGGVIAGVADRLPKRIAHIVYLDAEVYEHGENILGFFAPSTVAHLLETVEEEGDGWLVPPELLRDEPLPTMKMHPFKTYTDRIDLKGPPPKAGTVIFATEEEEFMGLMREKGAQRAKERGWEVYTVEGPHPLQEKNPSKKEVAKILLEIADSIK